MTSSEIEWDHSGLDVALSEVRGAALRHISQLAPSELLTVDVVAIAYEFAVDPPTVRTDRVVRDEGFRESIDLVTDLQTGHTNHEFFVPVERGAELLQGVDRQKSPLDGYPLGFLRSDRRMISIRLTLDPIAPVDDLATRLDARLKLLDEYAAAVSSHIQEFNVDTVRDISALIQKRRRANESAQAAVRVTGVPSIADVSQYEVTAKMDRGISYLGSHMTGTSSPPPEHSETSTPSPRVFIVHGHDETLLHETKDYLQNTLEIGRPVVLREAAGLGKTIIEKFEREASVVDLVFVLLSPDDHVIDPTAPQEGRRARQNVIFEMGFFLGKLGRSSGAVILLHKGPVELPSDITGVEYVDVTNGVKAAGEEIRRELRALGVKVAQ